MRSESWGILANLLLTAVSTSWVSSRAQSCVCVVCVLNGISGEGRATPMESSRLLWKKVDLLRKVFKMS